jgi:hypothetical protein
MAVIVCVPTARVVIEKEAIPFVRAELAIDVPPSTKFTVPVGLVVLPVTVTVNPTA